MHVSRIRVASAWSTDGTGEYAPIPPVFGPVSPSPTRLWSCGDVEQHARAGAVGHGEHATPRDPRAAPRTTIVVPASPKASPTRHRSIAATAVFTVGRDGHALARGEPVGLDHRRPPSSSTKATAFSTSSNAPARAVGTPRRAITSFANAFDPSIRAAAADGPKTLRCRFRSASARPATSGASGPTTVRSTVLLVNQVDDRVDVVRGHLGETLGDRRDAGVPGGREHARHGGILRQAPGKRVLAPPSADHQDLHERTTRLCSRAGPTPTIEIGTPPSSSSMRT